MSKSIVYIYPYRGVKKRNYTPNGKKIHFANTPGYEDLKNEDKNAIFDFWFLVSILERPYSVWYWRSIKYTEMYAHNCHLCPPPLLAKKQIQSANIFTLSPILEKSSPIDVSVVKLPNLLEVSCFPMLALAFVIRIPLHIVSLRNYFRSVVYRMVIYFII